MPRQFSFLGSAILAAALAPGCQRVYTEALLILKPFRPAKQLLQ
jgi:predicted nucleic acid-binding protein